MSAVSRLDEARAAWARGDGRRAVALGWDAVNNAMDTGIDEVLTQVRDLAQSVAQSADARTAKDAAQLREYCRHCLAGVGNGTQSQSLLALLTSWRRRRCPDCAESIARDARVCPHCGFRLAPPPAAA